jgi:demethylmenaquinone methyltransferase/2-methoxy-6-polyprenyl-1,4-benzoquinol methylase
MDTRAFYDRISGVYDFLADRSEGACRDHLLSTFAATRGECILEVGCGTGHALQSLSRAVGAGGRVYGLEISPGMLAESRQKLRDSSNALPILCDARALCFPAGCLDGVFMSFTLELFETQDVPTVLAEAYRVLEDGGRLGLVSMTDDVEPNRAESIYLWMHRHFPLFVDCRPIAAAALVRLAGFEIVSIDTMSVWGLAVACLLARKPLRHARIAA